MGGHDLWMGLVDMSWTYSRIISCIMELINEAYPAAIKHGREILQNYTVLAGKILELSGEFSSWPCDWLEGNGMMTYVCLYMSCFNIWVAIRNLPNISGWWILSSKDGSPRLLGRAITVTCKFQSISGVGTELNCDSSSHFFGGLYPKSSKSAGFNDLFIFHPTLDDQNSPQRDCRKCHWGHAWGFQRFPVVRLPFRETTRSTTW